MPDTIKFKTFHAVVEYCARKAGARRPKGHYGKGNKWYPDKDTEECDCCAFIRSPSRNWPNSLLKHCYSLKHVCTLLQADEKEVRKICKQLSNYLQSHKVIDYLYDWLLENTRKRTISISAIKGVLMESTFDN